MPGKSRPLFYAVVKVYHLPAQFPHFVETTKSLLRKPFRPDQERFDLPLPSAHPPAYPRSRTVFNDSVYESAVNTQFPTDNTF